MVIMRVGEKEGEENERRHVTNIISSIKQVAGAGFGSLLLICLLKFTLYKKS